MISTLKTTFVATAFAMVASKAAAANFYEVHYYHDDFLSFEGSIIVPPRTPTTGVPYVWPGLQPPDNSGVLQPVLDGRNSHWYFGNAYVGNPSQPYGGGVDVTNNEQLGFYMRNDGNNNWAEGVNNSKGQKADYTFNINKSMNQALFVVELTDTPWDFGDVVFKDVVITAKGTDSSWCTATPLYQGVKDPNIQGLEASSGDGISICKIGQLTLSPA